MALAPSSHPLALGPANGPKLSPQSATGANASGKANGFMPHPNPTNPRMSPSSGPENGSSSISHATVRSTPANEVGAGSTAGHFTPARASSRAHDATPSEAQTVSSTATDAAIPRLITSNSLALAGSGLIGAVGTAAIVRLAFRALELGAAYGMKIRAPHALVMTLLFGKEPSQGVTAVMNKVAKLSWEHGKNLAYFAFIYKLVQGILRSTGFIASMGDNIAGATVGQLSSQAYRGLIGAVAGAVGAYFVWSKQTNVSLQILLYLTSRVIVALFRLLAKQGYRPFSLTTFGKAYPWFAIVIWAAVMGLYEADSSVLHPSLAHSMDEIYGAADKAGPSWNDLMPSPLSVIIMLYTIVNAGSLRETLGAFSI